MTNKNRQVQTYDRLDSLLEVFRDNKFRSADVYDFIQHVVTQEEPSKGAKWQQRYEALDTATQKQMEAAANTLHEAYTGQGPSYTLERLAGDMQKICNFNNATPHFRSRQHMQAFLTEHAIETERETDTVPKADKAFDTAAKAATTAAAIAGGTAAAQRSGTNKEPNSVTKRGKADEQQTPRSKESSPQSTETGRVNEQNLRRAGAVAGATVGAGAAAGAAHQWRERVKKPQARKKAIVFASVATVSAIAVAAALFMKRDGADRGRN